VNRDLERRLRRLEFKRCRGGIRFAISDEPLSDEEWLGGPPNSDKPADSAREQPMGIAEWEATFCHDTRH
jgi:hypothetical protein